MSDVNLTTPVEYREIDWIPGYRFGSDGSVWSRWVRGHSKLRDAWKLKATHRGKSGYLQVGIKRPDRPKGGSSAVHLLIAMAFHGPCPEGMECRHKDGNSQNNQSSNLAWATHIENENDKLLHGTRVIGSRHGRSRLMEDQVREIRSLLLEGKTIVSLAARYDVCYGTIYGIATRRFWKHIA